MNACLQWNAPGIGGPVDQPQYNGPTADELAERKMRDAEFLQMWATDIPLDVFQQLVDGDDLTFAHRFRYEMKRICENEGRVEHDECVREWEKSL